MGRILDLELDTPVKIRDCHVETMAPSGKALLILFPGKKKRWVPMSQITEDSEVYDDFNEASHGTLVVRRWWAKEAHILDMEA